MARNAQPDLSEFQRDRKIGAPAVIDTVRAKVSDADWLNLQTALAGDSRDYPACKVVEWCAKRGIEVSESTVYDWKKRARKRVG